MNYYMQKPCKIFKIWKMIEIQMVRSNAWTVEQKDLTIFVKYRAKL